jgi:NADPH-dependent 2,4-dienoyl-CoA reductase/sulfur reductase-like enzyme
MPRRYLIIGSGVAGLSAAEAIRSHDPAGELTVVGDDPHGYYSRPGLAYYLDKTIPERQLFPRSPKALRESFTHRVHARVTQLLPDSHEVVLEDSRHLSYDRLLLATGAGPIMLPFPGNDLRGVVKFDTLNDVSGILKLVRRGSSATVIGGGVIGMELAEGLAARGMAVHHLIREDTLWWPIADETESRLVQRGLQEVGIQLHFATQVARALGEAGRVTAVETQAGETIPCCMLGVTIGVRPRIELAKSAGLATERGALVSEYLETSAPDVFAAGNVAQVRDPRTGGTCLELLWGAARMQGQVAGANMAGAHGVCTRSVSFNVVRVGGIITATIGTVVGNADQNLLTVTGSGSEGWRWARDKWTVENFPAVSQVRVLVGERTIAGAVVMGDQSPRRPLLRMVEAGVDITPIRLALLQYPNLGIDLIARFCREWERSFAAAWG